MDDDFFDEDLDLEAIRRGRADISDAEVAERLVDQVSALMVAVATGGPPIKAVNTGYVREYRALAAVLGRLGIDNPNPYGDLWRWYGRWSDETLPTYASRRVFIAEMYAPVRDAVEARDAAQEVAEASAEGPTGWAEVDAKMATLRRRLREAEEADDFKAVGLQCAEVLQAVGRAAFDAPRHLPEGEEEPHANAVNARIGYFMSAVASGERFEHVRRLGRSAWAQAQAVKHRDSPNRTDAGIAADAAALFVAIIRRLADEDRPAETGDDDIPF